MVNRIDQIQKAKENVLKSTQQYKSVLFTTPDRHAYHILIYRDQDTRVQCYQKTNIEDAMSV